MSDPPAPFPGVYALRLATLGVLFALSAGLVAVAETSPWYVTAAAAALALVIGVTVSGLFGVPLISVLLALMMFVGAMEGAVRGGKAYGWPGALAAGALGVVVSPIPSLLLLFVLVCFLRNETTEPGAPEPPGTGGGGETPAA